MEALRFTPAQLQEPRYDRKRIVLQGEQPLSFDLGFPTDFVAFIDVSQVDPNKVYVAFNEPHEFIPISKVIVARLPVPALRRLLFTWEASEEGKTIEIYYAGAPALEIGANLVTIGGDYVGLARDSTLQSIDANIRQPTSIYSTAITINNSVGAADLIQQLFSTATPAKSAAIRVKAISGVSEIYIGGSTGQAFSLTQGEIFETKIDDLSKIYIKVPKGGFVTLEVVWEA